MENTTTTQNGTTNVQNPVTYKLELSSVPYNDSYRIRSGATAQLIRGVQVMLERVSADKETDEYKKTLYPKLRDIATQLIDNFNMLLQVNSQSEYDMRRFNLFGYDGQVRPDRFGRYPYVKGVNPNTKYAFANFGYFIKMLKQRMEFISTRETPQRYTTDDVLKAQFATLKSDATNFLNHLNTNTESQWNAAVVLARESGGVPVKQNLEQRVKTQTVKREQRTQQPHKQNANPKPRAQKPSHNVKMCSHEQCHQNCKQVCGQKQPRTNSKQKFSNNNKRFALPNWVKPVTNE